jgi:ABC-2 type transport system ATP-binding protein
MQAILCDHLTKVYDGITVVNGLCLEVREGEVFGLIGPDGAGKSTTLRMLAGLVRPTSGACYINGTRVAVHSIEESGRTGYMPENIRFAGDHTAEEILGAAPRLSGLKRIARQKRISDLLALVGLEQYARVQVKDYSGELQRRLGIARALVNDPNVVLLDEPTANLAPRGAHECHRIIRSIADHGTTVLFSSQVLSEVGRVCTSAGVLINGKLVACSNQEVPSVLSDAEREVPVSPAR